MYANQTGQFSKKSSLGNQYIIVLIELDSNAILVEAMKNRMAGEMICVYKSLVDCLHSAGIHPKMHLLNNKCSADFKKQIKFHQMKYQLIPPNNHRQNIAETAIKICKAHFISILCGCDKSFLLYLWDRLLLQAEHTLNMLQPARMTPSVSAYAYLWGQHNYNAKPFAPLGCKVEAHITPGVCKTWAPHTASGYYLGNTWEHYRCHEVYISDTQCIRTCLTVFFKHKYLTTPSITPDDALIQLSDYLTDAISGLVPKTTITADAVDQLMTIFKLQDKANKDTATAQRVLRDCTQAERVIEEEQELENDTQKEIQYEQVTPSPTFQVKNTNNAASAKLHCLKNIGQEQDTTIGQHAPTAMNKNTHIGFLAPMHGDPWLQSPVHTKTGSCKTVSSTFPMQLCLLSPSQQNR
jgi:hypothetical protein